MEDTGDTMSATAAGAAAGSSFGPWGTVIGAGIGAASSLFGGKKQNDANEKMAQQQMDFQERMRKTQYQTAVADLKAAGLNPMLAYSQGGAGTPQGATAQMGNPLGEAGNSAREGAIAMANLKTQQTQNVLTEEQAEKTAADANLSRDQAELTRTQNAVELARMPGHGKFGKYVDAQMNQLNSTARQARASSAYTEATQPEAHAIGRAYRDDKGDLISGERMKQIEKLSGSAKSAVDTIKSLRR